MPPRKMKLSFLSCVESFQNKIDQGQCYICVACNRTSYKKSVTIFKSNDNSFGKHLATNVLSYDNKNYISMTCKKKTQKNKIPCRAVFCLFRTSLFTKSFRCTHLLEKKNK